MAEWTHKRLVKRMAQWLKGAKRMSVVMSEMTTRVSETPDVIGWTSGETTAPSILVECKVSRADFLADGKKWFRRYAELGMGDLRYVAAPAGLLTADEMPDGWGLLEVDRYVRMTKEAGKMPACKGRECVMLVSALRRLEIATAVYVVAEDHTANNRITMKPEAFKAYCLVQGLNEETGTKYTRDELSKAFDEAVKRTAIEAGQDPELQHWKDALLFTADLSEISIMAEAVSFFTATELMVRATAGARKVKLAAAGYRAGPAGDH